MHRTKHKEAHHEHETIKGSEDITPEQTLCVARNLFDCKHFGCFSIDLHGDGGAVEHDDHGDGDPYKR